MKKKVGDLTDAELNRIGTEAVLRVFGRKALSPAAHSQRKAAAQAHWNGRGASKTVRVDADAADALLKVPMKDRRTVASNGIREAVKKYRPKQA